MEEKIVWQKCPLCEGKGTVIIPSVVGSEDYINGIRRAETCSLCDGEKIINVESVLNPTKHKNMMFEARNELFKAQQQSHLAVLKHRIKLAEDKK